MRRNLLGVFKIGSPLSQPLLVLSLFLHFQFNSTFLGLLSELFDSLGGVSEWCFHMLMVWGQVVPHLFFSLSRAQIFFGFHLGAKPCSALHIFRTVMGDRLVPFCHHYSLSSWILSLSSWKSDQWFIKPWSGGRSFHHHKWIYWPVCMKSFNLLNFFLIKFSIWIQIGWFWS